MKSNPCRNCKNAFVYRNRHTSSLKEECRHCEKLRKHIEYLETKRKFKEGEIITNINELLEQEWVIWFHSTRHIEVIKNTQLKTVLRWIELGAIRKAIRKEVE